MIVIKRRNIPLYLVECHECGSEILYKRSDVQFSGYIVCPVCGCSNFASFEEYNNPSIEDDGDSVTGTGLQIHMGRRCNQCAHYIYKKDNEWSDMCDSSGDGKLYECDLQEAETCVMFSDKKTRAEEDVKSLIESSGYEDVIIFSNPDYAEAFIGISEDNNASVYDYDKMIKCLMDDNMTEEEAVEFIDYNTMRALPYMGENHPIIVRNLF